MRYLFYHTRKRLSRLFSNFFKKFFELFVNLQSRNQSVLYSLFTLFLIEKPLSFSSLSCDSSNILSYLQAIVKTFLNFFLKFFEFSLNFDSGIQSSEHSFSTLVFLENPHFIGFFRRSLATASLYYHTLRGMSTPFLNFFRFSYDFFIFTFPYLYIGFFR